MFKFIKQFFKPQKQGTKVKVSIKAKIKTQIIDSELVYYPIYSSLFRKGKCCISLNIPQIGMYQIESRFHYFHALFELRKKLEKEQIFLLCWGLRKDVWPSGMQADMGAGIIASQRKENLEIGEIKTILEFSPEETIVTTDEQRKYITEWNQMIKSKS